jgi:hypothetical protein
MFRLSFFNCIPGFGFGHSCNVFKLKLGARRKHRMQDFSPFAPDPRLTKRKAKDLFEKADKKARLGHMASASKKKLGKQFIVSKL